MNGQLRTGFGRQALVAGLAVALSWGAVAGSVVSADEPVTEPPAETGEVDGATVAVAAPPVPPAPVEVAVGLPPVPPTVEVAVGLPPVPPTVEVAVETPAVEVAVGLPPVPPSEVAAPTPPSARPSQPQALAARNPSAADLELLTEVIAPVVAVVEAALALLDASL